MKRPCSICGELTGQVCDLCEAPICAADEGIEDDELS